MSQVIKIGITFHNNVLLMRVSNMWVFPKAQIFNLVHKNPSEQSQTVCETLNRLNKTEYFTQSLLSIEHPNLCFSSYDDINSIHTKYIKAAATVRNTANEDFRWINKSNFSELSNVEKVTFTLLTRHFNIKKLAKASY